MMINMNPELEQLRKSLHPEAKLDIVEQCRIVAQALSPEGDYPSQEFKLAQYLGVSRNLVYKMRKINEDVIVQLKDWLKTTTYRVDASYKLSVLEPEDQLKFVNLSTADKSKFLIEFGKMFQTPKEEPTEPAPQPTEVK